MKRVRDFVYRTGLDILPDRWGKRLLIDLAHKHAVRKMRVHGQYGEMSGLLDDDRGTFTSYFYDGTWQDDVAQVFIRLFGHADGGTFLDIGAHIGAMTMAVARNPRVTVHAFEPEPVSFGLLEENVRHNVKTGNVHLYNVALFSDTNAITFDVVEHWVVQEGARHDARTISVPAARLDEAVSVSALRKPLGIKIDAEGSEYHIYRGGRSVFRLADLAVIEYWPYGLKRFGANVTELMDWIQADFRYGGIIRGDGGTTFGPSALTGLSNIVPELTRLWDQAVERDVVDIVLTK